jgi:hypothetical protein
MLMLLLLLLLLGSSLGRMYSFVISRRKRT